jgi:high-affinity iron transporter
MLLEAQAVTFREEIEAFLIVALTLTQLRKARRQQLIPAAYSGPFLTVVSRNGAVVLLRGSVIKPRYEGPPALVAADSSCG